MGSVLWLMPLSSEKMLKNRCKRWEQKKRLTPEEIAVVLHQLSIRDSLNKHSEVRVRGKLIPKVEVRRYRKRALSLRCEVSHLRSSASPDIRVEVYTPPPSSVSTPDHLRLPEEIMQHLKDIIVRSFKEKIWVSAGDTRLIKSSRPGVLQVDVFALIDSALGCLDTGHSQESERLLTKAHAKFQKNLSQNSRIDLDSLRLFNTICCCARHGMINSILPTIEYFSSTLSAVFGPKHPTALLYGRMNLYLLSAEANALLGGYQTMLASLVDFFTQALGSLHWSTIELRLDYIREVILYNDYERGLSALRDLARSCDEHYRGVEDLRPIYADLRLLSALSDWGCDLHQEKLDLADKIFARTKQSGFPSWSIGFYQHTVYSELSKVWQDQREFDTAEFHLKEAIRLSTAEHGPRDPMTLHYQRKFEGLLRRRGKIEEANDVRRQMRVEIGLMSENI